MEKKKKTKKGAEKGTPKRKGPVSRLKNNENVKRKTGSPSVSVAASPVSSEALSNSEDDFNMNALLPQP
ncbi:unnamed protein product [Allacma fusca]|uniref:Uncharacterized protein n=1 Tax=Allacma fusca TaxID=39272 RepID=A0A8J2Q5A7_9HEXA|nr:unnamed protein product [Allacma fusca]